MLDSHRSRAILVILAAGLATAWNCAHAAAGRQSTASVPPSEVFSTHEIPLAPVQGDIWFSADRAWTWTEGSVHRIVLERDVAVVLGRTGFEAARAVIWLRRLPEDQAGQSVYQVFAFLEHVRTPRADAAIGIEAETLPVRGVIIGSPQLSVDLRVDGPPTADGPVRAEQATLKAMADAQRDLARAFMTEQAPSREPKPPREQPGPGEPIEQPSGALQEGAGLQPTEPTQIDVEQPSQRRSDAQAAGAAPSEPSPVTSALFRPAGVFYVSAGERVVVQSGEFDSAVVVTGGVVVQYADETQTLEITGRRGVVFLKPGRLADRLSGFSAEDLIGIYLEGEVRAVNGKYTFRAPSIYYDVEHDRALALEAIFWTYDERLGMPLYMRAASIRQEAVDQFSARKATLSNTAFFNPEFSIGVSSVTVNQVERDDGSQHVIMDARNITLNAGPVPFFWWPRYHGDPENIPIRSVGYQDSNRTGGVITTRWDAYTLLGIQPIRDLRMMLDVDAYFDRGIGLGLEADWSDRASQGSFYGYLLPDDTGDDVMPSGVEIQRQGETRGLTLFRHRAEMRDGWTVLLEASYASDEALVSALFPDIAEQSRELTTRLHVRKTTDNSQFYAEVKGAVNDFIIPQHQLQAPGYMVDKAPQVGYVSIANDLLPESFPGLLTHTWEASYAQMRFRFSEVDASSLGYPRNGAAQRVFGTNADESLGDLYRSLGLDESFVNRFDTRHEVSAQLKAGEVLITPFAIGRVTIYDDSFQGLSPNETDTLRWWGGVGATISTSFFHIDRDVESDLFDLHQLRHIVEPSITLFHSDSTIDRVDLPVFDDEVESLNEGSMIRLRLGQTWQTKRGGPGRWRSVDLFKLNLEYVWHSGDTDLETPIGRYDASRPELSVPGEYLRVESVLQLTEAVALAGETIYDFNINQQARSSIGVLIEHAPDFITTAEIRYINSQNITYGRIGLQYGLTDKYRLAAAATYDFQREDFQAMSVGFLRRFTIGELGVLVNYNNIRSETGIGFTFTPVGRSAGSFRTGGRGGHDLGGAFGS